MTGSRSYLSKERSDEQTALDACAAVAMRRGQVATLARPGVADAADEDHEQAPDKKKEVAVEHNGFNLHAGVRIDAGDNLGRERLARYALRPPLSLERLRRTAGPTFELFYTSDYRLPHRRSAWMLLEERMREAAAFGRRLRGVSDGPAGQAGSSVRSLR